MYVILPVSMKSIRSKTAEKKWQHRFPHYKSMGIYSNAQGQLTPQSGVGSGLTSNSSEISRMSLLPASIKRSDLKQPRKSGNTVSPIITVWELSVAMETRVLIKSGPKPNAALPRGPHPDDASHKI